MAAEDGIGRGLWALVWFWAVLLAAAGGGAAVLQVLGPPPAPMSALARPAVPPAPVAAAPPVRLVSAVPLRPPGAPIPLPDPALQEPAPDFAGGFVPRIAAGRTPMQAYAAVAEPPGARPRVAVLIADFAMKEGDSEEAVKALPSAVSFAVNPYALRPDRLLNAARAAGHELLVSLPLEPRGYPLYDAGNHALQTGASPAGNDFELEWALSRIGGYVGATGALGGLFGERFAASPQMVSVLGELARRGLLYIDPRVGGVLPTDPPVASRAVDVVIDEPGVRTEIDANLARLERIARDRGLALGLAAAPAPVTVDRIAAWAALLGERGVALVPVSATVTTAPEPATKAVAISFPPIPSPSSPAP